MGDALLESVALSKIMQGFAIQLYICEGPLWVVSGPLAKKLERLLFQQNHTFESFS
jgi:hypothetical protein